MARTASASDVTAPSAAVSDPWRRTGRQIVSARGSRIVRRGELRKSGRETRTVTAPGFWRIVLAPVESGKATERGIVAQKVAAAAIARGTVRETASGTVIVTVKGKIKNATEIVTGIGTGSETGTKIATGTEIVFEIEIVTRIENGRQACGTRTARERKKRTRKKKRKRRRIKRTRRGSLLPFSFAEPSQGSNERRLGTTTGSYVPAAGHYKQGALREVVQSQSEGQLWS